MHPCIQNRRTATTATRLLASLSGLGKAIQDMCDILLAVILHVNGRHRTGNEEMTYTYTTDDVQITVSYTHLNLCAGE